MKDVNSRQEPFKVFYTGSQFEGALEQIVWAADAHDAVNFIRDCYPWAVIVDWMKPKDKLNDGFERTHDMNCFG